MGDNRADLGFGGALEGFDPEDWTPAAKPAPKPVPEETRKVAEATGFRSREVLPEAKPTQDKSQRRRRTGRNAQFNIKARPETIAAFCAIADGQDWGLGETLEHAVALLEAKYGKAPGAG